MAIGYVGVISKFDHQSSHWTIHVSKLEQFFTVNGIKEDSTKRTILLNSLAEVSYKLLKRLCVPYNPETRSFTELKQVLEKHFKSVRSYFNERRKFYNSRKEKGESVAEWCARIKSLAANCGFGEELEIVTRDMFVIGINNSKLMERLFEEDACGEHVTLESMVTLAQVRESSLKVYSDFAFLRRREKGADGHEVHPLGSQRRSVSVSTSAQQQESRRSIYARRTAAPVEREAPVKREVCGRRNRNSQECRGLDKIQQVLLTHGDSIDKVAENFRPISQSSSFCAGISNEKLRLYGVQFHPEVDLTINGQAMLRNFLFDVAGLTGNYTMQGREAECIKYIRESVGSNKVLVLVSGGVDSTVCAALLDKALRPEQIIAVHIDNGFMRKNESAKVEQSLRKLGLNLRVIHASCAFSGGTTVVPIDKNEANSRTRITKMLSQTSDPEEKRKIIGDVFVRISDEYLSELNIKPEEVVLAQGTLRPDLIESASNLASNKADKIKTHHNDSELIRKLRGEGRVIEPLKDFHKDEIRVLGKDLGLPRDIVMRHPFPGPGLAIRVLCAEEPYMERDFSETQVLVKIIVEFDQMLQKKHALLNRVEGVTSEDEKIILRRISSKQKLAATLLPIRSVGVQGDCRSYSYVVGISSERDPDWEDMVFLAGLIPRICRNINRVCYIFGGLVKEIIPDLTPTYLTHNVISTIRQCDDVATSVLVNSGHLESISQMPVVLLPVHFDRDQALRIPSCQRSVVLRPFCTHDFMTGVPAIPGKQLPIDVVQRMVTEVLQVPGVSRVLYDLTTKPPATIEWE